MAMPPCALIYDCQRRKPWSACRPWSWNLPDKEMENPTVISSAFINDPHLSGNYGMRYRQQLAPEAPCEYRALLSRTEALQRRRVAHHFCPQTRNELSRTAWRQSHDPAYLCSESVD